MFSKYDVRNKYLNLRCSLSKGYAKNRDKIIALKLYCFLRKRRCVLSYFPHKGEPNPNIYIKNLYLLPKVVHNSDMVSCRFKALKKGYKGILEPIKGFCNKIAVKQIDTVIVPGVCFDMSGYRLGYGKGFYDKFLKKTHALKIGVAYDFCVNEKIKYEQFDVPVDIVLTEKRTIFCRLRR